ncbi:glutamate synthase large subunit [Bacillus sp. FJAT-49736]|uniref:glutamate synthase large subunit n=1 Tax=Bacillus sp. FJAT-49736 TaxID=2833582 RepID=UPI001BC9CE6E|nr:glutamate synthase large subunit [Bacillus sp. FJAT-49736]MBS4175166.1 glutamate synthase large subunit [Bacillus sp. FJAT-49736]
MNSFRPPINSYSLYRQEFEHDSCGIGFYADIKGRPSHEIVSTALEMLRRLDHRAGKSADKSTSDGTGILLQIPHQFFSSVCTFELPDPGDYAVGMLFLTKEKSTQEEIINEFDSSSKKMGLTIIGVRTVPVDSQLLSQQARETEPCIKQLFIKRGQNGDFSAQLYSLRKRIEQKFTSKLYIPSFSNRTIVYKGMLHADQLPLYFSDLCDKRFTSSLALIHSRYSTNTFPSWDRAHPNRVIAHNGEINTIKGNMNWFNAKNISDKEVIDPAGSDSAIFDNVLEYLLLKGVSLPKAVMMMVPEPWEKNDEMPAALKAFYEYQSQCIEPWDGPMALGFSDGIMVGAILDRNGLRPGRYYITRDDRIIFASEVGVVDIENDMILERRHLKPGELLLVDTEQGRIIPNEEIKEAIALEEPYSDYLKESVISLKDEDFTAPFIFNKKELLFFQKMFGYTYEELTKTLKPMALEAKEATGAMGIDTPLAVLSENPQLLFHYFKQGFSQVTNPPIDAIREECVISTISWIGEKSHPLEGYKKDKVKVKLPHPFLTFSQFNTLSNSSLNAVKIDAVFHKDTDLASTLHDICSQAVHAIQNGSELVILTDRMADERLAPIPSLLATSALHHHLIRTGSRKKASIVVDTGEARDSHQMAMLLGYGADAIHPYLALETIHLLAEEHHVKLDPEKAIHNYIHALLSGVIKIMSKVGISAIQSYRGAQAFEALGISSPVLNQYFTGTVSQIEGIGLEEIACEALIRHENAVLASNQYDPTLDSGSELQWRKNGEIHQFNPLSIHTLQRAARTNNKKVYQEFVSMNENGPFTTIRSLLKVESPRAPISIKEVEPVENILKRFKSGAMSYGSLSKEAHEALAIAMNRIGGKSNSGEGGEEMERFQRDLNGDLRRSAIKQVASGRFGVTSYYLTNADEIQIKMAQGAKPGEGGQLPGQKVYPWIAEVRGSTPGVGLISPPPHHDIYSIEDLAQLIYDLKSANPKAKISVKLVAKAGVGTIAAGVAKGLADTILISGHDGGTGASPRTSIKHAGIPWEIGLSEAHQTLALNGLRSKVTLEVDGKLMTGKDVVVAACLGAQEFGFATAPLVVLGCLMMRACHLDTCPVGIATQNPLLREKFAGSPDHIVNYMYFIAEEVREILASCGYRSLDEIVGDTNLLKIKEDVASHWKAKYLNLSSLLYKVTTPNELSLHQGQDHELENRFDQRLVIPRLNNALDQQQKVVLQFDIQNTDRSAGTGIGNLITAKYGAGGLSEDHIHIKLRGSAGQSLGAFIPNGLTISLEGDANDYAGKGLSGGKLIIKPDNNWSIPQTDAIVGNTSLFGATSGEAYIRGIAGQRFAVRNSGAKAVVEGVGDHGCEYMTGGKVVILGSIGKNFAAGMSGGIAYIFTGFSNQEEILPYINRELVDIEQTASENELLELHQLISKHHLYTGSPKAKAILKHWKQLKKHFLKIIPYEYKNMIRMIEDLQTRGISYEEATLSAFTIKKEGKLMEALYEIESFPSSLQDSQTI